MKRKFKIKIVDGNQEAINNSNYLFKWNLNNESVHSFFIIPGLKSQGIALNKMP